MTGMSEAENIKESMNRTTGKIIKGVGGLYQVFVEGAGKIPCSAKGILRYRHVRPLIGDNAELLLPDGTHEGSLLSVLPRKNELLRPAVANVDQAMIVFAAREPEPHWNLLDRFLIRMQEQRVPVLICINKEDKISEAERERIRTIYADSGHALLFTQASAGVGMEAVRERLRGKTTVLAGPSGVGKSTILNFLLPEAEMETGEISEKIRRGRHTTRHSELFHIEAGTYLCDTPGFSSLYLPQMRPEELAGYYGEFAPYAGDCRFLGCRHRREPDCAVKEAVAAGRISKERYENYLLLYEEVLHQKRYD